MTDKTKAVNLTEDEIECVIAHKAGMLINYSAIRMDKTETIERINYLSRRLKAFKEPEEEKSPLAKALESVPITADSDAVNPNNQQVKSDNSAAGWGTENG